MFARQEETNSRTSFIRRIQTTNSRKRIVDLLVLVATAPITIPVFLVVSLAIRTFEGGPILFTQARMGYRDEVFTILKFRTMKPGDGKKTDHARVTSLGHILRKTSLDELPQLWNIYRGDMSLVGPRPLLPEYLPFYSDRERLRHLARPGITGLAQTQGRNSLRWDQRLALDAEYVEKMSMWMDFRILFETARGVLASSGLSVVARDTGEPLNVARSYPRNDRFGLRRMSILDINDRVAWMNSAETRRWMSIPDDITRESTIDWFHRSRQDDGRDDFVVYDAHTGQNVAMLGLRDHDIEFEGVLYIFVDPNRQGEGIGREGLELLLKWVPQSRYKTIHLSVDSNNKAAVRLYETLGFRRAGGDSSRPEYMKECK